MVNALWFLLLAWAAMRAGELPKSLNFLGVVVGVAGIISVVLAVLRLMAVYGLGLVIWLIWLIWLGIIMLRSNPVQADQSAVKS